MGRQVAAVVLGVLLVAGCGGPAEPPKQSATTADGLADGCGPAPSGIVLSRDYTTYDQMMSHAVEMPVDTAVPTARRLSELGLPSRVGDRRAVGVGNEPGRPHPLVGTVYYADRPPDGL